MTGLRKAGWTIGNDAGNEWIMDVAQFATFFGVFTQEKEVFRSPQCLEPRPIVQLKQTLGEIQR